MIRVFAFWAVALLILVACGFLQDLAAPAFGPLLWGLTSSLALLILLVFILKRDRRTWEQIGLGLTPRSGVRFATGLAVGLGTYAATLLLDSLVGGPIRLTSGDAAAASLFPLVVARLLALCLMEELMFRSYTLWTAIDALGPKGGQALVAVAFGLLHLWYGWTWFTVVSGVIPSAVLFGVAAWVSRGLAWPFGIHVGLNLARWLTGEADGQGFWRLDLTGANRAALELWAPWIGALIPLAMSALLWWWSDRHRRHPATTPDDNR